MLSAFAFNLCLFFLPIAAATAFIVINRDNLYAYEYSEAGARAVQARVERLNGELIQLDFDRQRQWDDLVAMEVMSGDVSAARGFLLSAGGMLPGRVAGQVDRNNGDAAYERSALELLTPGTRSRYEGLVPLLSRRSTSGGAQRIDPDGVVTLGDQRDFEMLARSMLAESDPDELQFTLTGLSLGLGAEFTPRMARGAAALLAASRRDDYPVGLASEISAMVSAAVPLATFRAAATANGGEDPGAYANASAAFRQSVAPEPAAALYRTLDMLGEAAEATSVSAAAALLTHATTLADMPRLRLLAQAAGDRASAAAKRLPRDGRLLDAARGELTVTRDLAATLAATGLALAGVLGVLLFVLFQIGRRIWMRMQDDDYGGELVDITGSSNWRPL